MTQINWPEIADNYLQNGFSIIPVHGKKPLLESWKECQNHQATPIEIASWLGNSELTGLAVITGRVSNVMIIDVDLQHNPDTHKWNFDTLTAKTGNGYHYYFQYPENIELKNKVGIDQGVDI